jgi:hypothetical protein
MNTPSIPVVRMSISAWYQCTFLRIPVQPPSIESGMRNVVSRIIITAIPSTPSVKRTPHCGIQRQSIVACIAVTLGSYDHHRPSETANSSSSVKNAMRRAPSGLRLPADPCAQSAAAPRSGMTSRTGSTQLL